MAENVKRAPLKARAQNKFAKSKKNTPNKSRSNLMKKKANNFVQGNQQLKGKSIWHVDSGCSRYMTGNKSCLQNFKRIDGGHVAFGDNPSGGKISGKGIVSKGKMTFEDVYYVEQLRYNLLSVSQHKTSHKSKEINTISSPLALLHMDLFGPTNVMSIGKKSYCLVIVDEFSRFTWVYFLRTKDETNGLIKSFILRVENQTNQRVKIIRSDNGTEFKNHDLNSFCEEKGIERQYSAPRTPQQNGVVERRNRTLIEAARSLLAYSKLLVTFWAEAVNIACYFPNRVLIVKSQGKTPYELFNKKKPFIGFFKPFGCPCTILNTKTHLGKFDSKADDGFLVGYSSQSKAYRVFNTSSRIIEETDNVKCNESTPNKLGTCPDWLFDIDSLTNSLGFSHENNAGTRTESVQDKRQEFVLFPIPTTDSIELCVQEKKEASDSKDTETAQNEEEKGEKEDQLLTLKHLEPEMPALAEDDTDDENSSVFGGSSPEKNDSNLDAEINEEAIHQTKVHKDHPP
ncbi:hypothetical protein L6452_40251 [Arctium lappa]|uniref:Uncharacterized protein n=1 Tax=Arctium lappa TaxID=4217 RepID=A0ACB8XM65_ARCLA|nr:hypothetical protein L6452_40251 [Arctium lappa]